MRILITGGAGFIGSALVRHLLRDSAPRGPHEIINLDKLTYAGSLPRLASVSHHPRYKFVLGDICDSFLVSRLFHDLAPDAVIHLAAETHVDRSIDASAETFSTNINGTAVLLEAARMHWERVKTGRDSHRFLSVSTDEVFGSLGHCSRFSETSPYAPSSPYSASKAASDHLVNAWHVTYGLPTVVTNCSNNYGPWQFPEKLIPRMVVKALRGESLPIHGTGTNIRDWLHVDDHCRALEAALLHAAPGSRYCVGGSCEKTNMQVVTAICTTLDDIAPRPDGKAHWAGVISAPDRPGNDARYAIDNAKILRELGWFPNRSFEEGLRETVRWYLANRSWWEELRNALYDTHRLGRVALSTAPVAIDESVLIAAS